MSEDVSLRNWNVWDLSGIISIRLENEGLFLVSDRYGPRERFGSILKPLDLDNPQIQIW